MRAGVVALAAALVAAGCGSKGGDGGSLEALWNRPGDNVGLIQGTSDYAPGSIRVTFLVVGPDGRPVSRPHARLWIAASRKDKPFAETTAVLEPVGAPGAEGDAGDVTHLYVGRLDVPRPGRYAILAEPVGGKKIQALGDLFVRRRTQSPPVGAPAIASQTPTLRSTGGRVGLLTTRRPPDLPLLRYSIADSLRAHVPFVVVFATPAFCESRTCGPVVEVVDAVRRRFEGRGIRFLHVEIYRRNKPSLGVNRWVRQWHLPSEPWTFLVGRDGRIVAKFEGSVSVRELSAAVRAKLL